MVLVYLLVSTTNWSLLNRTLTVVRVKWLTHSPMETLTTSEALQEAWVEVGSLILTTNILDLGRTSTLTVDKTVIDLVFMTNSIVSSLNVVTCHQTFVSVCLMVNTTNWEVMILTVTGFVGWAWTINVFLFLSTIEVTLIVISNTVLSTNWLSVSSTVSTVGWVGLRTDSVMKFNLTITVEETGIVIGLHLSTTDRLVDSRTSTWCHTGCV